jgi:hypothetical protein
MIQNLFLSLSCSVPAQTALDLLTRPAAGDGGEGTAASGRDDDTEVRR